MPQLIILFLEINIKNLAWSTVIQIIRLIIQGSRSDLINIILIFILYFIFFQKNKTDRSKIDYKKRLLYAVSFIIGLILFLIHLIMPFLIYL